MRKTKIICTIGPASESEDTIRGLIAAGMSVARLNFSHGIHEEKSEVIRTLLRVREEMNVPLAILADTRGPEIRLGVFEGERVELSEGQTFTLTTIECPGNSERASVTYSGLPGDVAQGGRILLNDGLIALRVENKTDTEITTTVLNPGVVSSRGGVNVPGVKLQLPFISSADRADLRYIASQPFSYIAASFTRNAGDVRALREELSRHDSRDIKIIAKIENMEGLQNIEAIIDEADGIMIARGDLGVEIPLEELPILQKRLIADSYRIGIPVITATQMLESMITNPRPTRAEVSDVANAVCDGTSAVMLSGETAVGAYPVEACRFMAQSAERMEQSIDYHKRFLDREHNRENTVTNAVARAAVTTAYDLNCHAILTMTETGSTARNIAKFRPASPIIACTPSETTYQQLSLIWGVTPLIIPEGTDAGRLMFDSTAASIEAELLRDGDMIVFTAGLPLGRSGATNLMRVYVAGEQRSAH